MYVPQQFNEPRVEVLHELIRAYPLSTLITLQDGSVEANPIPMLLVNSAGLGTLHCHIARANTLWREHPSETEVLIIFQGPDCYISPLWYASKAEGGKVVPTWNYISVQAKGKLNVIDDSQWLLDHLSEFSAHNEAAVGEHWQVSDAPADFTKKLTEALIGIEIEITELKGKWKVSQNRPAQDKVSVIEALRGRGNREMADIVEQRAELTK